jgi:hypothetical protein
MPPFYQEDKRVATFHPLPRRRHDVDDLELVTLLFLIYDEAKGFKKDCIFKKGVWI